MKTVAVIEKTRAGMVVQEDEITGELDAGLTCAQESIRYGQKQIDNRRSPCYLFR